MPNDENRPSILRNNLPTMGRNNRTTKKTNQMKKNVTEKQIANLRPARNSEEARALGSRPKSEKGRLNQSIGKRLAYLKKKGLTDEKVQELVNILEDANMSSLDYRLIIEKMKSVVNPNDINQLDILARNIKDWHKTTHGEKHHNLNVNVDVTVEEWEKRLMKQ